MTMTMVVEELATPYQRSVAHYDIARQGSNKCNPTNSTHADLEGAQWDKKFYATETGKKYKALNRCLNEFFYQSFVPF